jgi:poly(3-hydroxybutyrate) depolymerase
VIVSYESRISLPDTFDQVINSFLLRFIVYNFILTLVISGCSTNTGQFDSFVYGKIDKSFSFSGTTRNYTVHIPRGYAGNKALPLVFVLHAAGSNGSSFYNESGWAQVCENENIFSVFPTAASYCITSQAGTATTSLWNAESVADINNCNGIVMQNDVEFLRQLLDKLRVDFNIDKKRIYVTGFANGGQMSAKMSLDAGDILAASSQFAGSLSKTITSPGKRNVPVLFEVGNQDATFFGTPSGIPMSSLAQNVVAENSPLFSISNGYQAAYGLKSQFTMSGDTTTRVKAIFSDGQGMPLLEISLLKNIGHQYPSGNQSYKTAEQHWHWMKTFVLP